MMDGVRLTDSTLHRARARLVVDGLVEQVGDTYRLTEAGNAAVVRMVRDMRHVRARAAESTLTAW